MQERVAFASFFQGGFEGSTLRRTDRLQLDVIGATRHDLLARDDYDLVRMTGLRTVRDALRWHLVERTPGHYDWSSLLSMLHAALTTETQVIWDLCHFGVPVWLDFWSADFASRFADFAGAAAAVIRNESDEIPFYVPVNEISFWSWAGGDMGGYGPYSFGRGLEMKRQLVRASIAAIDAVRSVDRRARFVQPEPAIHIAPNAHYPDQIEGAEMARLAQYEAFDMLAGRTAPELGGKEDLLDIIGVNYYWNNQWLHNGPPLGLGHSQHRPFNAILSEIHTRYNRPILVSETGAEGDSAGAWLGYVASEVRIALRFGLPIAGICLYPVMDYPGWDDDRHCTCGLIETAPDWLTRSVRPAFVQRLQEEAALCAQVMNQIPAALPNL